LQKAIYTAAREWHFGLALDYYSHFTSPIRRYPDLQIHRIIKEILNWEFTKQRYEHYLGILDKVAEQSSTQEDMAEKNESDVNKFLSAHLIKDKIGQIFDWYIDDIWTKQVKIILDNTISWILDLEQKENYFYSKLFEWVYEMIENNTKEIIWLGDNLKFEVSEVDEESMQIYFKIKK
jgi:ribonuclease R